MWSPWVEKYRPKELKDVVYQDEALLTLRGIVETGKMPHLLLFGPPGTGKTSSIHALAYELFGHLKRERVLELNASDQRGIDVIRSRVVTYARQAVGENKMNKITNKPMPNWKIILLDEADMLTNDAQTALRRIMEIYTATTRFVLICNQVHRIIGPIKSRCCACRYKPIEFGEQKRFLERVVDSENIKLTSDALQALWLVADGDLRRSVTLLQSAAALETEFGSKEIFAMAGFPPDSIAHEWWNAAKSSPDDVESYVKQMMAAGWDISIVMRQLIQIVATSDLKERQKAQIVLELARKQQALVEGGDPALQLAALGLYMYKVLIEDANT